MCWCSGALALDGCTYFMPYNARRILKFDPEEESTANVGERLGDQHDAMEMNKYNEDTVLGNNGWLYGIPYGSNRIVRFNPADHATSTVGEAITNYLCCKGGVLGRDGFIYVVDDHDGRVLKIDVVNNSYSFVGGNLNLCCLVQSGKIVFVLGNDGCIYWPPNHASRIYPLRLTHKHVIEIYSGCFFQSSLSHTGCSNNFLMSEVPLSAQLPLCSL